ncbi:hypothetical protein [Phenylobacterium sp.]|jgi:hypothetical protein|uniref:hypothetical protein n=1 Tax=Phenylobacterium sp. TaxID=1871053 RepID=UPI0037C50FEC
MEPDPPFSASRRAVLGASASLLAASPAGAKALPDEAEAHRILERYQSFGDKASGGPGDTASGNWLEGELKATGYACQRQTYDVPAYQGEAVLTCGAAMADLVPQAIVMPTSGEGVSGPLYVAASGKGGPGLALVVLPHARWSTAVGVIAQRVAAAFDAGATAVVIVTTGPTGEALALNAPPDKPLFKGPVAVMAPKDVGPFLLAAAKGETATLRMSGRSFRRPAFNVTATLKNGSAKTLVISTPRSGWFACAGERGSGMAAWLLLVRWAAQARLPVDIALISTSGHEYENAGGEHFIQELAPKPDKTALWVHLGANVAARDWHERGAALSPLPSADPQRFMLASPSILSSARAAFAGLPGLEQPYAAEPALAAGELGNILRAGYTPAIGIFGGHRFHHARNDDLRCVSAALIPPVAGAFARVISEALAKG